MPYFLGDALLTGILCARSHRELSILVAILRLRVLTLIARLRLSKDEPAEQ
jgi:hypothetical protein